MGCISGLVTCSRCEKDDESFATHPSSHPLPMGSQMGAHLTPHLEHPDGPIWTPLIPSLYYIRGYGLKGCHKGSPMGLIMAPNGVPKGVPNGVYSGLQMVSAMFRNPPEVKVVFCTTQTCISPFRTPFWPPFGALNRALNRGHLGGIWRPLRR